MAAISQTIGNVLGGMSSQPDSVKIPGQVRHATNVLLDPTFGCTKRPGTQFIKSLGTTIPDDAKWFPIFRDNSDRFIVCSYKINGVQTIRVFTADTGDERTVTLQSSAAEYIAVLDTQNLRPLTVNDYTFLVNSEKDVLMNGAPTTVAPNKGLVVINQVAYNTTYAVDFLRDGQTLSQVKVFKASKISVSPASFEVEDDGACTLADIDNFVENSGSGTGLGFRLDATCSPTLVTKDIPGTKFPNRMEFLGIIPGNRGMQAWFYKQHGDVARYAAGSYLYSNHIEQTPYGQITFRVEARVENYTWTNGQDVTRYVVSSVDIVDYTTTSTPWETIEFSDQQNFSSNTVIDSNTGYVIPAGSTAGLRFGVTSVGTGDTGTQYEYKSVYKVQASLNNGGQNWSVGDTVSVTMAGKTYTITVDETTFGYSYEAESTVSYTTAADTQAGVLNISDITSSLVTAINALSQYNATPVGNVIVIDRTDGRDFNLMTRGGTANNALYGLKDAVNDVSLLPPQCLDGVTLRVSNSDASDADDYFVKFQTEGGIPGQGAWEETIKPGIPIGLNPATMPHALIREADGNFTVRPLTKEFDDKNFWQDRKVGDETTSPPPTFVGKKIRDAFFYQNRLGFLSDDTVVLSQAGDYFNFFQGSAIAISDADPIDLSTSTTRPAKLKAAIGTPAGLLMFAENSQFLMKSEDVVFGPATVKIDEISNFAYQSNIHPVETGVSILFTTESATYSKVFELATESLNSRPQVTDNTRIVPELVPPGLTHITSVPNQSLVIFGTGDNILYVFKFFNSGNERQLAGWATWEMSSQIKMAAFDHDTGYFIGRNGSHTVLSKLEIQDDPETSPITALGSKFQPRIDNWVEDSATTIVEQATGDLVITLPDGMVSDGQYVYLTATYQGSETFYVSSLPALDSNNNYSFTVTNRLKDFDFIVGVRYDMSVELPSFYVKEENRADRRNPPMVENAYINVFMSGRYDCEVSQKGYPTRSIPLEMVTADIYAADSPSMQEDGIRAIGVYGRGDLCRLVIKAEGPLPAALTSYSWEGHYSTRGIARR